MTSTRTRVNAIKQTLMSLFDTHHENGVHGPVDGSDITQEYELKRDTLLSPIEALSAQEFPDEEHANRFRLLSFYFSNRMTSVIHRDGHSSPKYTNARDRFFNYISSLGAFHFNSIEHIETVLATTVTTS